MATLQGAISELVNVIADVSGINYVPDEPSEQISAWPAAMIYATDGLVSGMRASTENKSLHNVAIAIIMPLQDMRLATEIMLPFYELVTDALITHLNGRTSAHYSTWSELNYTLGPIEWPSGQLMYGYIFTIGGLKIINEV